MTYRKRPLKVDAIQFTGENGREVEAWAQSFCPGPEAWTEANCPSNVRRGVGAYEGRAADVMRISTLEGVMTAGPGDWIVRGIRGEFYPVKADIFEATYEIVNMITECHLCASSAATAVVGLPGCHECPAVWLPCQNGGA